MKSKLCHFFDWQYFSRIFLLCMYKKCQCFHNYSFKKLPSEGCWWEQHCYFFNFMFLSSVLKIMCMKIKNLFISPESLLENEMYKILWDFEIQMDHPILKINMVLNKKKRTCQFVDFAIPEDFRVKIKESKIPTSQKARKSWGTWRWQWYHSKSEYLE